jgi:3-oxoacyl-[acyl-carrier protein] reductase
MGNPDQANYNAAKAAILGLTKGLAKEWGALGVNVNAVAPGFIETRLTAPDTDGETIHRHGRRIPLGIPEHRRRQGTTLVPLGRLGSPLDVAETVAFLCSQRSNYIHGQVLGVTGGLAIGMEY